VTIVCTLVFSDFLDRDFLGVLFFSRCGNSADFSDDSSLASSFLEDRGLRLTRPLRVELDLLGLGDDRGY